MLAIQATLAEGITLSVDIDHQGEVQETVDRLAEQYPGATFMLYNAGRGSLRAVHNGRVIG